MSEQASRAGSPWVTGPLVEPAGETIAPQPSPSPAARARGLGAPAPRGNVLGRTDTTAPRAASLCWLSTSGGAGSTSLARASREGVDLTGSWPSPKRGWPTRVVLVARADMAGLNAAGRFLQEWAGGLVEDIELLGLVLSADAPARPPRAVRARMTELRAVTTVWHLPWIPAWRETPYTPDPTATKLVATVAASITQEEPS